MNENQIRIKLLKAAARAHRLLAKINTGLAALEQGDIQKAEDSIPPDNDPPDPPGGDDEEGD